ncbi:hypothetical protein, partial [Streptomyces scabiei]
HDPQVPCSSASEARQHDQPAQAGAIRANAGALSHGALGSLNFQEPEGFVLRSGSIRTGHLTCF